MEKLKNLMTSATYGLEQKKRAQIFSENGGGYQWWGWELERYRSDYIKFQRSRMNRLGV